ncbi:MAG: hypothetical protein UW69_C0082G0009 [Microgenomates group bacterium GW2011_GWA2_44_7]|nr:MAG: hypothetical protein UW69_C0082G0009 [Microgenomates group bacterium GW2011_GWA2_44_7]
MVIDNGFPLHHDLMIDMSFISMYLVYDGKYCC